MSSGSSATPPLHTFATLNSLGPICVNITLSEIFSSLSVQNRAQPFVKEQIVCFPKVFVAVFTEHGHFGPCSVYHHPSNPACP